MFFQYPLVGIALLECQLRGGIVKRQISICGFVVSPFELTITSLVLRILALPSDSKSKQCEDVSEIRLGMPRTARYGSCRRIGI